MPQKKIVIVGASSSIAEHCARLWARDNDAELVLLGRNIERIERIATDLKVRSPACSIRCLCCDFLDPIAVRSTVDLAAEGNPPHIVLIAHGALSDQHACQNDTTALHDTMAVNAVSPVMFAEAFAGHLGRAGAGKLAIIGSVAGDRGRKSNYVYGAAKGLIARYAEGLQHRFADSGVVVVLVKPGPTDTPMTAELKQRGVKLASVEEVAATIVQGIESSAPVIYAPARWRFIMAVIRHLPRAVFNRLNI